MQTQYTNKQIRKASGEELLLMAILGNHELRNRIDQELDRRAGFRHESVSLMQELGLPTAA